MTKSERIWLFVGFLALAALIMLEVRRVHMATLAAAAQGQFGTPQSTNPIPSGQQVGPSDGQDAIAAGVGPWYLYYNTPGSYSFNPPVTNISAPPNFNASPLAANGQGCATCH